MLVSHAKIHGAKVMPKALAISALDAITTADSSATTLWSNSRPRLCETQHSATAISNTSGDWSFRSLAGVHAASLALMTIANSATAASSPNVRVTQQRKAARQPGQGASASMLRVEGITAKDHAHCHQHAVAPRNAKDEDSCRSQPRQPAQPGAAVHCATLRSGCPSPSRRCRPFPP